MCGQWVPGPYVSVTLCRAVVNVGVTKYYSISCGGQRECYSIPYCVLLYIVLCVTLYHIVVNVNIILYRVVVNVSVTLYRIVCYSTPFCVFFQLICSYPACSHRCTCFYSRRTFPCPHHVNKVRAVACTPLVQTGVHVFFCPRVVPVHARIMLIIMSVELRIPRLFKQVHMFSFASYLHVYARII